MPLVELDGPEASAYLAARENCHPCEIKITALAGGVSNHVLLIETPSRRYVVKQSLEKLRVKEDWFCRRNRIWDEAEAIRLLSPTLPAGAVPELLYEDPDNYLYAMSVAPGDRTWKSLLLAGEARHEHAQAAAAIHRGFLTSPFGKIFDDLEVFDQLRLDAYYRFTPTRHPDLAPYFNAAIDRCRTQRTSLVHGDWSPKNMIVDGDHLTAIDFEAIHFGDPSFDAAFLLNHFLLKMFYLPAHAANLANVAKTYWTSLATDLTVGTLLHLPLLLLARIDGKSPAEYIQDEPLRNNIRQFARSLIGQPHLEIPEILDRAANRSR